MFVPFIWQDLARKYAPLSLGIVPRYSFWIWSRRARTKWNAFIMNFPGCRLFARTGSQMKNCGRERWNKALQTCANRVELAM